ncbi:MAG: hypothetical protein ACUVX9_04945 [Anaerolineae bacterium]
MISKIQKARRYAEERDRITFDDFDVTFRGEHDTYRVSYQKGHFTCCCGFFLQRGVCSHTMALERVLNGMLVMEDRAPNGAAEVTAH